MKYVGFVGYENAIYALREDGRIFRFEIDFVTKLPKVGEVHRLPTVPPDDVED